MAILSAIRVLARRVVQRVADAEHILDPSASTMSSNTSRKRTHSGTHPPGSGSSGQASSSKRKQEVYGMTNTVLDAVANAAEASDVLAPLKAACRTTKSILEVVQVRRRNWAYSLQLTNTTGYRDQSRRMGRSHKSTGGIHVHRGGANRLARTVSSSGKGRRGV